MIKSMKLIIERDKYEPIEINLEAWQGLVISELLGLEVILSADNQNKYTIKRDSKDEVMKRIGKLKK
ncbi:hypothetical protein K5V21_18870 [Clostridium sardiniense]|uniref:Uncharacterized protein n=1 Tax=Clostridium sardiniense TaxID=29369 RepID=A0ABS7L3E4_CLOSR|nr:hypothetical protein [Clostridium sardiniense]MBY0757467.1 hypothetical protein [Clostridium sardiniense]MDQ0462242.1 hypothetical protein [Clostridium sardiniense]